MREMTMKEYFRHTLLEEVRKDAEKQGIRIIDARPRPHIVENEDNVVSFSSAKGDEGLQQC